MSVNSAPVHCLRTNPRHWTRASLPRFQASSQEILQHTSLSKEQLLALPWSQRHEHLCRTATLRQEIRWQEATGVEPGDSHFTLIVPVYNEEHSLPSFLSTLMLADIPSSVDMNIIFITNACADSSPDLIDTFLARLGQVEARTLQGNFQDSQLNRCYKAVELGQLTFMHIETRTAGKGHALRTGNSIARSCGHTIAMCIDANDYIELDAIRWLFRAAHKDFRGKPAAHDVVIYSGTGCGERRASSMKKFMDAIEVRQQHLIDDTSGYILGCLMTWNTEWLHSIGGPLGIALEDYAMGVLARAHNYTIGQVQEARIWSYDANAFTDLLETRARYVRGMLQVLYAMHYTPGVMHIVEQDSFYMRGWRERLIHLFRRARQNPLNFPRYLATFFLWEYAISRGKQDFKRNPTNPTWKKIASTR